MVENEGGVTSLSKRFGVQALLVHCRFIGSDFTTCIITVPALTMGTSEVARVAWLGVDVRLTEKTGCLDERERELAQHREVAEDERWTNDATEPSWSIVRLFSVGAQHPWHSCQDRRRREVR
jgi:hypothetical protein